MAPGEGRGLGEHWAWGGQVGRVGWREDVEREGNSMGRLETNVRELFTKLAKRFKNYKN